MAKPLVLALGDAHSPWIYWPTVDLFVKRVAATRGKANVHVVQLGDLLDMYSFTRFPRSHDLYTPKEEVRRGRAGAERIWERIQRANPKAKCWQLIGNHDVRPHKRISEQLPETSSLFDLRALWQFDKVTTMKGDQDDLIIGNISIVHGFTALGGHVEYTKRNTICGHLHRGNVVTRRYGRRTLWEANAGWCGNPKALPLSYSQLKRYNKTTQGWLECEDGWPTFRGTINP